MRLIALLIPLILAGPGFSQQAGTDTVKSAVKAAPPRKAKKKKAAAKAAADPVLKCFVKDADGKLYLRKDGQKAAQAAPVDSSFVTRYEHGKFDFVYDDPDPHVGRMGCKDGKWSKVTEDDVASCGAAAKENGLSAPSDGPDCAKGGYIQSGFKPK